MIMILWDMTDAVSIAYVCGDTADKAYKELSEGRGKIAAVKMGVDVLLWQLLASVAVPGLTIHLVVRREWSTATSVLIPSATCLTVLIENCTILCYKD